MRALAARCHLSLGEIEWRAGQADEARRQMAAARDELRAIGIMAWRARAESALA